MQTTIALQALRCFAPKFQHNAMRIASKILQLLSSIEYVIHLYAGFVDKIGFIESYFFDKHKIQRRAKEHPSVLEGLLMSLGSLKMKMKICDIALLS